MHELEPYYKWREYYIAEEDHRSPFYQREYSEFYFENSIYNYAIHPQWDGMGSNTLFLKIIFANYEDGFAIIELLGEWNDCITNDVMLLKRDIIDMLIHEGINKFVLIAENVLNFHFDMDDYYAEWFDDVEDGWIVLLNAREHVRQEFERHSIDQYFVMGGKLDIIDWRVYNPK